jgi:Tfp pilus assembly protein PilF
VAAAGAGEQRRSQALVEYEKSLGAFPNRFNSHYGAARAAESAGKPEVARTHYEQLVAMVGDGDGRRKETKHAQDFLTKP